MPYRRVASVLAALWLCFTGAPALAAVPPEAPDKLKPPAGQVLALEVQGVGVQIYVCGARKDDATKLEWTLKAPEADLFDAGGKRVGRHYGGPTWEAGDGSKVVGEVTARDDGPDTHAIPWLLLSAKSTSGSGLLSRTTSVQRLRTVGGKAPTDGCAQAADAGREVRIPYQAAYYFYTARP
jgi:hypothetical protein